MRLFVAAPLENRARERFAALGGALGERLEKGRVSPPDNLHLTLHFLGEQPGAEAAVRAVEAVRFAAFSLRFDRLGRFRRRDGDLLWAGVQAKPALETLHADLAAALEREGLCPERRPFRPHLTLARRARLDQVDERALERAHLPIELAVARVCLMESVFGPQGVSYRTICEQRAD